MRLISIDVGLRNFSWCTLLREPSIEEKWLVPPFRGNKITIEDWHVVDIVELSTDEKVNLNNTDIATIVPWFWSALETFKVRLTQCDLAMIEAQPTAQMLPGGKSISNIKTKVLSHLLQAFFVSHSIPVKFISPACKLRDAKHLMSDLSAYSQHKKAAVQLTLYSLTIVGGSFQEFFSAQKGKKDDLADSFLQGVCGDIHLTKKTKKPKRKNEVLNLPVFE
jgi:hypothetical protein